MGGKTIGGFAVEQCVKAFQSGRRFLRSANDGEDSLVRFMQDSSVPMKPGEIYSSFDFDQCRYDSSDHTLSVETDIVLPMCADITIQADIIDLDSGRVYVPLGQQTVHGQNNLIYKVKRELKNNAPSYRINCMVVATANWQITDSKTGNACIMRALDPDTQIDYQHTYPKKETNGFVVFEEKERGVLEDSFDTGQNTEWYAGQKGGDDTINIALYRTPENTADLDYLCLFGKKDEKYPYFTVPAAGKLQIKDSNVEIISAEAACFVRNLQDDGGYVLVACSDADTMQQKIEITQVSQRSIEYEYTRKWDNAFTYAGNWKEYLFEYTLQIVLHEKIGDIQRDEIFYVSSDEKRASYLIPYISIKWGCVAGDTRIRMADGTERRIQDIQIGDRVSLADGTACVRNKWKGMSQDCVTVSMSGRVLRMSGDHPVMTADGWKRADELTAADHLLDTDRHCVKIEHIGRESGELMTYNLTYDDIDRAAAQDESWYNELTMIAEGVIVGNMDAQNRHISQRKKG